MTKLKNPVRRETDATYQGRSLVVQIEPPTRDNGLETTIKVKEKGRKTWYAVTIEEIFSLGAKKYARKATLDKQANCPHKTIRYGYCKRCKKRIKKK